LTTPTEDIHLPVLKDHGISLSLRREDKIHPLLSGNKFRKLKYNVEEALKQKHHTLLTFGGAYSNHIPATAYAAELNGLRSIGIIRGEELAEGWRENPTLTVASEMGMQFEFISRTAYRGRSDNSFLEDLGRRFGKVYIIPEGGTNELGVSGCEEILQPGDERFHIICCAVGTGGTLAGLSRAASEQQAILGFPALKGNFLEKDIRQFTNKDNWTLIPQFHFGGYGRVSAELIDFINSFRSGTGIPLDPVYTGKMMYGLLRMVEDDAFDRGTRILAVHTGGLQGIKGMNGILKKKNLPLLTI
jgi:1-aminocyclopropane-1-carboxylate deaminase